MIRMCDFFRFLSADESYCSSEVKRLDLPASRVRSAAGALPTIWGAAGGSHFFTGVSCLVSVTLLRFELVAVLLILSLLF